MKTFEIHYKDNVTNEQRIKLISDIHHDCLLEDPDWHFFYEEEQGDLIRCGNKFEERILRWLTNYKYYEEVDLIKDFTVTSWELDHPIVDEFKLYHSQIFHANSELVMWLYATHQELTFHQLRSIVDRVVHSLHNNIRIGLETLFPSGVNDPETFEARTLSSVLLDRAFYSGIRYQYKKHLDYLENHKDEIEQDSEEDI